MDEETIRAGRGRSRAPRSLVQRPAARRPARPTRGDPISVRFYARSDIGRRRRSNEDSVFCSDDFGVGIVADGMGGHRSGEIASSMAVELISKYAAHRRKKGKEPRRKLAQIRVMLKDLVEDWTHKANAEIYSQGNRGHPLRERMGTTVAFIYIEDDIAAIAHVGDSRIYRIRSGEIDCLTRDHSIFATDHERRAGKTGKPRKRKYVTRALGTKPRVRPDVRVYEVMPHDLFVLCSDGLTDGVSDDEIKESVLRATSPDAAVEDLIRMANEKGGADNITVLLAKILPDEDDDDTEAIAYLKE